jgi:hypothetical protein
VKDENREKMRLFTLVLALLVSSCAISAAPTSADLLVRWEAPEHEENGDRIEDGSLTKYEIYKVELDGARKIIGSKLIHTVDAKTGGNEWRIPAEYTSVNIAMKVEGATGTSAFSEPRIYR